jgi:hypothetical protein
MSIQDFHSQFVTPNAENPLFYALRKLSELDDLRGVLGLDSDDPMFGWGDWSGEAAQ